MTIIKQYKYGVGLALVTLWLLMTVYAFWWFQFRLLQPFTTAGQQSTVLFDSDPLRDQLSAISRQTSGSADNITVVHFWDPDCPCNRFNEAHVKQLMQEYGRQGVRFVVVAGSQIKTAKRIFTDPAVIEYIEELPSLSRPPSSPAVAIMDKKGELAYFGPYSVGAVCSVGNGAFVEKALDKVLSGINPKHWNTLAVGCFCSWPAMG